MMHCTSTSYAIGILMSAIITSFWVTPHIIYSLIKLIDKIISIVIELVTM